MRHNHEDQSGEWADRILVVDECRALVLDTLVPLNRYRPGIATDVLAVWPNRPMTGAEFMRTMFQLLDDHHPRRRIEEQV